MSTTEPNDFDQLPGLSNPARRALAHAGYTRLEQLREASAAELLRLHGFGPKGIRVLRAALAAQGWAFAGEAEP